MNSLTFSKIIRIKPLKPTYIVGGTENSRHLDTSIRNTTEKGARRKEPSRDPKTKKVELGRYLKRPNVPK